MDQQSLQNNMTNGSQDDVPSDESNPTRDDPPMDQQLRSGCSVAGFFNGANGVAITNSSFTYSHTGSESPAFTQLHQRVSTAALRECAEHPFGTSYFPNTRETLLNSVINDIDRAIAPREAKKIKWISGAAGSGKTSIAHSIAERCLERGIIVSTFFFGRLDSSRNTIESVVPTISYQLCEKLPAVKRIVSSTIADDPLVFNKSFRVQYQKLVIDPLRRVLERIEKSRTWSILILFDGLDECPGMEPHQVLLIQTISNYVRSSQNLPLTILITSRPELHLSMQFTSESDFVCNVDLDTSYAAHDDIRHYLITKFNEIKTSHPFKKDIAARPENWPSSVDIEKIMKKSSGQFIYAAVLMNFVSDARSYPPKQLETAMELQSHSSSTPSSAWATLDSMYHFIFSQLPDLQQAMLFVSFVILAEIVSLRSISSFFDIPVPDIHSALGGLVSIINCQGETIVLLHASLPDFLLDKARSGAYHIDPKEWKTRLCVISLNRLSASSKDWDPFVFLELFSDSQGTSELRDSLSRFNPCSEYCSVQFRAEYIDILENMDLADGGEIYRKHRKLCSTYDKTSENKQTPRDGLTRKIQSNSSQSGPKPNVLRSNMVRRKSPAKYACQHDGCAQTFTTKHRLKTHVMRFHSAPEQQQSYICETCPFKTVYKTDLARNKRSCSQNKQALPTSIVYSDEGASPWTTLPGFSDEGAYTWRTLPGFSDEGDYPFLTNS